MHTIIPGEQIFGGSSRPRGSTQEAAQSSSASEAQALHHDGADNENDAPRPPRIIDENTDLTTLTDEEIAQLTQSIKQVEQEKRPLVSAPVPVSVLANEIADSRTDLSSSASENIQKKLQWLQENGWDMVWRARGDGDCFYRSFTLAYFLRILHSDSPELGANLAFSNLQMALPLLEAAGFDKELTADFLEHFTSGIRQFAPEDPATEIPREWDIIQALQDPEQSNSTILRLLTSAYLRANADYFAPFLMNPETFEPLDVIQFCNNEVEPCSKEADQVQIMALARCLRQGIRVVYLDGSDPGTDIDKPDEGSAGKVSFIVEFEMSEGEGLGEDPLMLLYRPGHYDVLTKDDPPPASR